MAELADYDFDKADAGASYTVNSEAGQIRVGGYMCIKDRPAKVSSVSTSKTGKHGSAKCNFTAIDIFNGKKYEDIQPSTANVAIPTVVRKEFQLLDINAEGFCTLMDDDGNVREDIKLPEFPDNLGREIKADFESGKDLICHVLSAMGHDQIIERKENTDAQKEGKKKE